LRRGKEYVGVTSLFVGAAPYLDEPQLRAEELERGIEIANPQHGMKISHDGPFGLGLDLQALPALDSKARLKTRLQAISGIERV
jgi:hypothetical protein